MLAAVDDNGNVIVTLYAAGDYATIKYSNGGVALWTNDLWRGSRAARDPSGQIRERLAQHARRVYRMSG